MANGIELDKYEYKNI